VAARREGAILIEGSNDTMTAAEISERKEESVIGKIQLVSHASLIPPQAGLTDVSADRNLF